ncbi:MAG: AAA family ATPase [Ottowia sp.]|nr:AAA family ATPase [Ottowia sp.]
MDEYDKPLLESAGNEALQEHYRATLRAIYSNLKSCDAAIKFALLTGVTKFSKLSVFSDLNNLNDISMQREYGALCGITESELETYFAAGIAELAQRNDLSVIEARARLKKQYDGYLFHPKAEHVYNPFSLLNALSKNKLGDYWFESGTPRFLVHMMKREGITAESLTSDAISPTRLGALDSLATDPLPILYQSGYLTIASATPRTGHYRLKFPNEEVESGFFTMLLPLYANKQAGRADTLLSRLITALDEGKPEDFMRELQALLADIPYEQGKPVEAYFRNLLFIIFRLVGFYCEVEHPLAGGRSDMVIKTDQYIYLLELKVDQNAAAALAQIEEKAYAAPYAADPRTLFKIGLNFSTQSKQIDDWQLA